MSTLYYVKRTNQHEDALPGATTASLLVDAAAALVPAEVLALHALVIGSTTVTAKDANGQLYTVITDPFTLRWLFWVLLGLAVLLYLAGRMRAHKFDRADVLRAMIPPAAFVCWTMLQKATVFDAAWPELSQGGRFALAVVSVITLGAVATMLAFSADQKMPGWSGVVEPEKPETTELEIPVQQQVPDLVG